MDTMHKSQSSNNFILSNLFNICNTLLHQWISNASTHYQYTPKHYYYFTQIGGEGERTLPINQCMCTRIMHEQFWNS